MFRINWASSRALLAVTVNSPRSFESVIAKLGYIDPRDRQGIQTIAKQWLSTEVYIILVNIFYLGTQFMHLHNHKVKHTQKQ
jgi:hypothetical protein